MKHGDNAIGSVRLFVSQSYHEIFSDKILATDYKFGAKNDHYQAEESICVSVVRIFKSHIPYK